MRKRPFQTRTVAASALWLGTMLSSTGCLFQKKPRAYVPPRLPPPVRVVPAPPPLLDTAPAIEVAAVELPESAPPELPPLPAPAKPQPPPRRPPVVATAPKPTPPPAEVTPTLPRITQILSAQQIRDYTRELDEALNRSMEVLKTAAGKKNLTAEQRETMETITVFQKQAVQAREDDLVTAVNYARRADLLAKDLLAHLP